MVCNATACPTRFPSNQLISHRALSIEEIEDMFFIGRKTVQRDISEIRDFLHDLQIGEPIQSEIVYDRNSRKYKLTEMDNLFRRISGFLFKEIK
ncbi:hypothetical protein GQS40_11800|uniref:HTH domain-containing protein n=1 Tax=Leuconostoc lactis TaxID=1246 RepID=A0A6L7ABV6_LEULA|nr:hypothetical protein [Leuconostoc lactis]